MCMLYTKITPMCMTVFYNTFVIQRCICMYLQHVYNACVCKQHSCLSGTVFDVIHFFGCLGNGQGSTRHLQFFGPKVYRNIQRFHTTLYGLIGVTILIAIKQRDVARLIIDRPLFSRIDSRIEGECRHTCK